MYRIRKSLDYNEPNYDVAYYTASDKKSRDYQVLVTNQKVNDEETHDLPYNKTQYAFCLVHGSANHDTEQCNAFDALSYSEKKTILYKNGRCFRCLGKHVQANCQVTPECSHCQGPHITVLHKPETHGQLKGAGDVSVIKSNEQQSLCTTVCKDEGTSSCSKVILVDLTLPSKSNKSLRCYCIIDEQ